MTHDRTEPWGEFPLAEGEGGFWRIGPLSLRIYRLPREIRVVREQGTDPLEESLEVRCPVEMGEEDAQGIPLRFVSDDVGGSIRLRPRPADRNVVTRPEHPLNVLPGDTAALYVSTPCWVEILVNGGRTQLLEVPTVPLSDTWFGPSTKEGTLCYAARTSARLELAKMPLRPHRAVAKVVLKNSSAEPLLVERMNLPTLHLGLFADSAGNLWTETVHLERKQEGQLTDLDIGKAPPREAGSVRRVSPERAPYQKNLLARGFATLIPIRGDRYGSDIV